MPVESIVTRGAGGATPRWGVSASLPATPPYGGGMDEVVRRTMFVRGWVQGVGFRWWARSRALELGLSGYATNLYDGRVEVVAQGPRSSVEQLEQLVREVPSTTRRPGSVESVMVQEAVPKDGIVGFDAY